MAILEVKNLSKQFGGVRAVVDLSISFEKGKITSVVGPNGSGKTTLMNVLSGVYPFEKGVIVIEEEHLKSLRPEEISSYGITRTFQDVHLFNQMTVLDNILVVLTKRSVFESLFENFSHHYETRAKEVLDRTGLWEKRHMLAGGLSYGQRKLLEIARVLAMKPEIILFDEPFAGLFPEMVKVLVSILQELASNGKTVILIEHNMELIRKLSSYVYVMDSGSLLAEGKPEEVLARRAVVEAYLGK